MLENLHRAHGLLNNIASSDEKALARLINVEFVGAVFADLSSLLGRCSNEMLARNHGLLIGQLGVVRRAQVIGAAHIINHILIHLELLESALASRRESLIHTGRDAHRLKRALTCTGPRVINTALHEVSIVLHTERIAIGCTGSVEHCLHFLLGNLIDAGSSVGVQNARVGLRTDILAHTASKEGNHVIVCKVGRGDHLTGQLACHEVPVDVVGSRLDSAGIHSNIGCCRINRLRAGLHGRIHRNRAYRRRRIVNQSSLDTGIWLTRCGWLTHQIPIHQIHLLGGSPWGGSTGSLC